MCFASGVAFEARQPALSMVAQYAALFEGN
jgi:hypothetical protein